MGGVEASNWMRPMVFFWSNGPVQLTFSVGFTQQKAIMGLLPVCFISWLDRAISEGIRGLENLANTLFKKKALPLHFVPAL